MGTNEVDYIQDPTEKDEQQERGTVNQILSKPAAVVTKPAVQTELPEYKPGQFYDNFQKQYAGRKPMTPEEQKVAARRERTNKIIAGVGDMLSALSNLYFTTKGAPNAAVAPQNTMSANMQARYDQLRKEREAQDQQYFSDLQKAQQLENQYNLSWQQLKEQRKLREQQQKRQEQLDAERRAQQEELIELRRAQFEEQKKNNQIKADQAQQRINKSGKKGSGGGRSSGGQQSKTVVTYDKNGKPIRTVITEQGKHTPTRTGGTLLPKP